MIKRHFARHRVATVAFGTMLVAATVIVVTLASGPTGGSKSGRPAAQSTLVDTTSTSPAAATTSTAVSSKSQASGGLIAAGASRSECLTPHSDARQSGLAYVQSLVTSFESVTNTTVTCLSTYLMGTTTWSQWIHPWVLSSQPGYAPWVAQNPQNRQLVLAMNLIPDKLANVKNPLRWEESCAKGAFNSYAKQLGRNLVAAGLANSVLRLGPEMNGVWESDFIGTAQNEQRLWAKCFANEATSFRQVAGEHFLMDWNPNACVGDYPYANFYPGNKYVDIVGLDLYDVGCNTPYTSLSFSQLTSEPSGLSHFEAFAASKRKPMSLPEWGLSSIPTGDDPAYINGIGTLFTKGNWAFETYFDQTGPNMKALPLSSNTPLSLVAFQKWFGSGPK